MKTLNYIKSDFFFGFLHKYYLRCRKNGKLTQSSVAASL
jgi:hypothetical protein